MNGSGGQYGGGEAGGLAGIAAVEGDAFSGGVGVLGTNPNGSMGLLAGPEPFGNSPVGAFGRSNNIGVFGFSDSASPDGTGVFGNTNGGSGNGVHGHTSTGVGVLGTSDGKGFAGKFIGPCHHDGDVQCTQTITAFDVAINGGDCAEDFDVTDPESAQGGTLMIFDQEGKVRPNCEPYDKRVVGVVSGAGEYQPGIVLNRRQASRNRVAIALLGTVFCKVDASYSPIELGDLLTTSPTPGHAMKAEDPLRAFGTVIGKALRPLSAGQGLIPILIALR
jgi:hypothetical protein